jgi:hypothetical protein
MNFMGRVFLPIGRQLAGQVTIFSVVTPLRMSPATNRLVPVSRRDSSLAEELVQSDLFLNK